MSPQPASSIRSSFLEFFRERGHDVVPSAPLIPQNDPTLMFVNAGMVPFKDVFTGRDVRSGKRATSSQKCIRISGKHNDLENVGVTARHHTFFEMLGNFSFGDYFKEEAIVYAWDYLTKVVDLPKDRLVITVFKGEEGLPADEEAAEIWRKVTGFGDDRILRLGMADNFWSMGDTGPCGPCSEIHFFHGSDPDVGKFGDEPRIDGLGWTEIWNNVFMQFNRAEKGGPLEPLPAPSIDTGMGLERIACAVQGVTSNYDTDLLRVLVDKAASISGKSYGGTTAPDDVSMRVIADHARTTAMLISEGVMPDRNKREYVLRRVMRRAIRHGHRLGIERPFLHEVTKVVIDEMGGTYGALREREQLILRVTEEEEVRFRVTLKRGIQILEDRFKAMGEGEGRSVSSEVAADLYSTYGFPLDLTEVICREAGVEVDVQAADQIVKAGPAAVGDINPDDAMNPSVQALKSEMSQGVLASSTFTGYETESGESTVLAILRVDESGGRTRVTEAAPGEDVEVLVLRTPFYAESGGQMGDSGTITKGDLSMAVTDTQRPLPGVVLHIGRIAEGTEGRLRVGDVVSLSVDGERRRATRRNHSATHLLHWALKVVLGEHALQKGSRVAHDMLRFDFAHGKPLTRAEQERIEDLVNDKILGNAPVITEVLAIDEARKKGAVAIFEEKYGDVVRVLTMTRDSVELCGGTHVSALGDIGSFRIDMETGVAAGVRRIFASTGKNALARVRQNEGELSKILVLVKAQRFEDAVDKVTKILAHEKELEKKVEELLRKVLEGGGGGIDALLGHARSFGSLKALAAELPEGTAPNALREFAEKLRDRLGERSAVCLASAGPDKVALCIMVSKAATGELKAGDLIKELAKLVGGSGGGRPDMAQAGGTDRSRLGELSEAFYAELARRL